MPVRFLHAAIIEQYIKSSDMWMDIIELDTVDFGVDERVKATKSLIQTILASDFSHVTRESDGCAAIINRNDGPIRIKWRRIMERC